MKIKATLTKKYGPLPAWAWALVIAVVLFGVYYLMKKRSAASGATTSDTAGSASDNVVPIDSGSGGGGGLGTPESPASPPQEVVGNGGQGSGSNLTGPVETPRSLTPQPGATTSPSAPTGASKSSAVSGKAIVQESVSKALPGINAAIPKAVAAQQTAPHAVKIAANKTGGSANIKQGVFAVH